MILVDTSVWTDHLRRGNALLSQALEAGDVLGHAFVSGELACGSLQRRATILALLDQLPQATVASHAEVMELIETRKLMSRGLGLIDMHLLASALMERATLFTLDTRLAVIARALGVGLPG